MNTRIASGRRRAAMVLGTALLVAGTLPVHAAGRPDLLVGSVSNPPSGGVAGGDFVVTVTTKNGGGTKSGASTTRFYLSKDAKRNRGDVRLAGASRVRSLNGGKSLRTTTTVTFPDKVAAGAYYLIACADDTKAVRESNESNNCRAANRKVQFLPPPQEYDPTPFGDATPVSLTPTVDAARAVTETIDASEGGTMITTAADGTTFTLEIPQHALLSDEQITITPLSGVSGDPLQLEFSAGAHLQPEGLQFVKAVKLTVEPTSPPSLARETSLVADGDGTDLHLYPLTSDPSTYTFELLHFTVVVLGGADAERRAEQLTRRAADAQAALAQESADILRRAREDSTNAAQIEHEAIEALRLFYLRSVRPLMAAAQTNVTLYRQARRTQLAWQKFAQLLGIEIEEVLSPAEIDELFTMEQNAFDNFVKEVHRRCVVQKDLAAVFDLLSLDKERILRGGDEDSTKISSLIEKCATFEFEFDSKMDATYRQFFGATGEDHEHVGAKVRFSMIAPDPITKDYELDAQGVIDYKSYSAAYEIYEDLVFGTRCTYTGVGWSPDVFTVLRIGFNYNAVQQEDFSYEVSPRLNWVKFNTGTPKERDSYSCHSEAAGSWSGEEPQTHWQAGWSDHHNGANQDDCSDYNDEGIRVEGSYCKIAGWTAGAAGSGVIAEKSISHHVDAAELCGSDCSFESQEETRLYLRHVPQP